METLRVPLLVRMVRMPEVNPPEALFPGVRTVAMVVVVPTLAEVWLPLGAGIVIVVTLSVGTWLDTTGTVMMVWPPVGVGLAGTVIVLTVVRPAAEEDGDRAVAPSALAVTVIVPPSTVTVLPCTVTVVTSITVVTCSAWRPSMSTEMLAPSSSLGNASLAAVVDAMAPAMASRDERKNNMAGNPPRDSAPMIEWRGATRSNRTARKLERLGGGRCRCRDGETLG